MGRILVATGFEAGEASALGFNYNSYSTTPRTGSRALSFSYATNIDLTLPEAASRVRITFAVQTAADQWYAWLYGSTELGRFTACDGAVRLHVLGSSQVHTYPPEAIQSISWKKLSFDIAISPSGWVDVWMDSTSLIHWEGNTGTSPIQVIRHRKIQNMEGSLDDYYLETADASDPRAPLPDYRIIRVTVWGDGASSQWWGSDGDAASNYLLIDEIAHNADTDYVSASLSGLTDLYKLRTPNLGIYRGISFAGPLVIARKTQAADNPLIAGIVASGASLIPGSPWSWETYYKARWSTSPRDPFTGCPWEASRIGNLEVGITSSGVY